jgi:hypothetical protein
VLEDWVPKFRFSVTLCILHKGKLWCESEELPEIAGELIETMTKIHCPTQALEIASAIPATRETYIKTFLPGKRFFK